MNTKKTPKITEYDSFSKSPFTVELTSKQFAPETEHHQYEDEQGNLWGKYQIPKGKAIIHDPKKYIKLFTGNTDVLMALTESSMRLFYYIIEHLPIGRDEICIDKEDFFTFAGYAIDNRVTFYKAIEGLLKANIIARRTGNPTCFYVNPDIIFNGDRTKLQNRVIKHG